MAGADAAGQPTFSRTLTSVPTSVFLVTGPQGESLPALVVANNGEFQGIGGTEAETTALVAAGMPLAVAVETANLEYLGTAADDAAPGQQVAWYARREAAHATRLLKIAQGGSGVAAVTLTDYAAGTVMAGSYHPQKKDARHLVVAAAAFLTTFCRHEPRPIP